MDAQMAVELTKAVAPILGVPGALLLWLLLRERNNKKAHNNPGNPSDQILAELKSLRTDQAALLSRFNEVAGTLKEIKGMLSRRNRE